MKPQHFLVLLLIVSSYWIYQLYQPFWMTIVISSLLAMSTINIHHALEQKFNSKFYSALLSSLLLALVFLAPLSYFLTSITIKLNSVNFMHVENMYHLLIEWLADAPAIFDPIKPFVEEFIKNLDVNNFAPNIIKTAGTVGGYSAQFVTTAFLIIIFYFFALYYGKNIISFLKKVIQLPAQDITLLGFELSSVMSVVFYSIITTAVFEGALFGIAITFLGFDGLLFGIMYGFASLLPVVGGAIMWIPFMLFEFSLGNTSEAIFIALYSIIVISIIADTFIKPLIIKEINLRIVKSESKMNELLIFFAIIAGLSTFGFWGMILGPAITAFFMALLHLLERHNSTNLPNLSH